MSLRTLVTARRTHVVVVLVAGAGALVALPTRTASCGSPVEAWTREPAVTAPFVSPQADSEVARRDAAAVVTARTAVSEAEASRQQAEALQLTADQKSDEASQAQTDLYSSPDYYLGGGTSYEVTLAESDVSAAENSVDYYEDDVQSLTSSLERNRGTSMESYYASQLAAAQEYLADASTELAQAQADLTAAESADAQSQAAAEAAQTRADDLQTAAQTAQQEADAASTAAAEQASRARQQLEFATTTKDRHEAESAGKVAAAYTRWYDGKLDDVAANAVRQDCRDDSLLPGAGSAVLTAGAAGLVLVPVVGGVRRGWRWRRVGARRS